MTHEAHPDLMDALFTDELPPERARDVMRHIAACEGCKARYDRMAYVDRVLGGGPSAIRAPSKAELDRVAGVVFARLAPPETESALARFLRSFLAPAPFAAAAAAVVLAVVLVPSPNAPRDLDGFQARGSDLVKRPARVRAFCTGSDGAPIDLQVTPQCSIHGQLELALANPGGYRYAFVVGVQPDLSPRWYAPKPPETRSAEAPGKDRGDVPFGAATRLDVNHDAGPLRIYALFSDDPIEASEVERAIARLGERRAAIASVEALPLARPGVAQRSVLVQVTP
jgi:hypothetical protein